MSKLQIFELLQYYFKAADYDAIALEDTENIQSIFNFCRNFLALCCGVIAVTYFMAIATFITRNTRFQNKIHNKIRTKK